MGRPDWWGRRLSRITISETVNLDILKMKDPGLTYLNGTLLFVGGLARVHAHKRVANPTHGRRMAGHGHWIVSDVRPEDTAGR